MEKSLNVYNGTIPEGTLVGDTYTPATVTLTVDLGEVSPSAVLEYAVLPAAVESYSYTEVVLGEVSYSREGLYWFDATNNSAVATSPGPGIFTGPGQFLNYRLVPTNVRYLQFQIVSVGYQDPNGVWGLGGGPASVNLYYFAEADHVPGNVRVSTV